MLACGCSSTPEAAPLPTPTGTPTLDFHASAAAEGTQSPAPLSWRPEDRRAAIKAGVRVMSLFARPDLERQTWWDDLEPLLSDQAARDYAGVDPANVPVRQVTGPGRLVPLETALVTIVHVATDAGLYAVTLSRSPEHPQWRADRITPPEPDPHGPGESPADSTGAPHG